MHYIVHNDQILISNRLEQEQIIYTGMLIAQLKIAIDTSTHKTSSKQFTFNYEQHANGILALSRERCP